MPLSEVHVGERLRVRPGERVPVDGDVVDGRAAMDESMVTGEPIPVEKAPREPVTAGTVNGTGTFVMEAERIGADTLLAQIVRHGQRGATFSRADSAAGRHSVAWFVPAVIVVAIATFAMWSSRAGASSRSRARQRGRGPHHRVPVRARIRHADVHHGGDRTRCGGRHPVPQRGGARAVRVHHDLASTRQAR